jgi:2-oxoglutarate/2-oxoacid ferredoxin oxidoreductase subunit beta
MNQQLTAKDFTTDQEVRWCPGCGDYAIVNAVRKTLAQIGTAPENVAFVSGIGCAARFPYYIDSYGFHTVHGRAPAVASGLKIANPDLDVWVVGGDGDFLSIGGNHVFHALRRNINLNLLLLNNAIYGLTKGQYSPTSRPDTRSPSTPAGSVDRPANAILFALGAGARFIARSADTLPNHLPEVLTRAHAHQGASLVEILQNCIVYNDGVWGGLADKTTTQELSIRVQHGEPMVYGKENDKGLVIDFSTGEVSIIHEADGPVATRATVYDETSWIMASAVARMEGDNMPTAIGVIFCDPADEYITSLNEKVPYQPVDRSDLKELLFAGGTWTRDD